MHISGDLGFKVFHLPVTYYGLFIILGITAAAFLAWRLARRHGACFEDLVVMSCICGVLSVVGAKLLYILVSLPHLELSRLSDPSYLGALLSGGFVFYGGLLGALCGIPVSARVLHVDTRPLLNLIAPCLALGHGIGRLGCLSVGCCYGMAWSGPFSVTYDHSIAAPNGVALLPVQLIEAVLEALVCVALVFYVNHRNGTHAVALYLGSYAIIRFILEFFRADGIERGIAGGLSTSQWISIALLVALVAFPMVKRRWGSKAKWLVDGSPRRVTP